MQEMGGDISWYLLSWPLSNSCGDSHPWWHEVTWCIPTLGSVTATCYPEPSYLHGEFLKDKLLTLFH